jgi:drug/metabolite transporter (DMT)-like permease
MLFGLSAPLSKILVKDIAPVALAGLLYLGAFAGLAAYFIVSRIFKDKVQAVPLEKKDIGWLTGAIIAGGIVAPISMIFGLQMISGFSASLFLNLEGIFTVVIAAVVFKENSGKRLWLAAACMTIAGIVLAWDTDRSRFSIAGPLLITLACAGWAIDNNLTRQISEKDPIAIGMFKGLIAGGVMLSAALIAGNRVAVDRTLWFALAVGACSYGVSLVLFIKALRGLGSSRTGIFFSFGPFVGAAGSIIILKEWLGWIMLPAVVLTALGVWLIIGERHTHPHEHAAITHTHEHNHNDTNHHHSNEGDPKAVHSHVHTHEAMAHNGSHWPDAEHRHLHEG